jgi:ubiquinone/menaquinone biosynthesis C-methylase UbiE
MINLDNLLDDINRQPNVFVEIEVKFKNNKNYNQLLSFLRLQYQEIVEQSTVSYYDNNIRKIVTHNNTIVEQKIRLKDIYDYSQDFGFVVSVSSEKKVTARLTKVKFVRQRLRHSFRLDENYQIDLTEVQEQYKPKHEIELEYIGDITQFNSNELINHIMFIYKILTNTLNSVHVITLTEMANLNFSINTILNEDTRKNFINNNIFTKARNIKYQDLVYGGIVGNPIQYYISHKADGLFKMFIVNPIGLWLVYGSEYNLLYRFNNNNVDTFNNYNNVNNIVDTSVYISEAVYKKNQLDVILVYDCIISQNQDLRLKNLNERVQYINNALIYKDVIKIEEKINYELTLDNFFETIKLLFKQELTWPTDGFIFTPNTIYNPHTDQYPLNKRLLINYPDICKWKPASKITIDFRVILNNNTITLYVYDRYKKQEVPFTGNVNKLTNDMLSPLFYQNINLYHNKIVECAYDPICQLLTPIKIRPEKNGPNNLDIALSNWTDLHDPITDEDLKGNTIEFVKKYHNQIKNNLYGLPTIYPPIQNFEITNYTLLDIGGGQGGDINKWMRSKANHVYTVEPNSKNLNQLQTRLANTNYQNHVTIINTIGEDTDTITQAIKQPVDMVSLMLSLSFFWADETHLDALVHTISNNLNMNGYVTFLTIDGDKLKPYLNNDLILNDVSFTLYQNKFVRTEITGIVGKQWEFLVNLKQLTQKLSMVGIQLMTMRDATEELLLSPQSKLYTSLFTYGVYQRIKPNDVIYHNNILSPIIYPTIPTLVLSVLEDDEIEPIKNTINHTILRLGCLNNIYHCLLKAMYPPYQETTDVKKRYQMVEDFKKELQTTDLISIGHQLDIDIYIFNYDDNDLVLKEFTFDCQQPQRYAVFILQDKHYNLLVTQDDYIKTQFKSDDTLLLTIKKLTQSDINPIYIHALIKNIKKQYQLPKDTKLLYNQLISLFNTNPNNLISILNQYKKLKQHDDSQRIQERVKTITSILNQLKIIPTQILDIGAADAKITMGLKNYYQLNTQNVYAIDQKLANTNEITPLTYVDGKIPLDDKSVNVIILFAVLHHIPPTIRQNLMTEIARVLKPGGVVIIREHDDNKQDDFLQFINLIHSFWYITANETNDPLYMLSKQEFETLFNDVGLQPIYEQRYDEPNPQRLYHEVFIKPDITNNVVINNVFNQTTFVDDFPYKKYSMDIHDIDQRFHHLKNYSFTFVTTPYTIRNIPGDFYKNKKLKYHNLIIKNEPSDYLNYNLISDYFMDECRMQAKRYDQVLTPWEYWHKNKQNVIDYAKLNYGEATPYTLREAIYKLAGEPSSFRPTIMSGFIKMFKATKVLDISSGWGDRCISCMAEDIIYVGVDPNTCLMPHYQDMIQHFATDPNKYIMIQSPFETAVLPDMTFDLVLSSPPFAELEHYSDETTQSTFNRNLDEWFDDFLMASLIKAWKVLESGGHMVIIINDIYNVAHYVEKMVQIFTKMTKDATFLGVISYSEFVNNKPKSPQPCWIWYKK